MKLVRTSVVVASVFCASLAWSAESRAQSSGAGGTDQAQHDKKATGKKTDKTTKETSAPASSSSTSGSATTDTSTQSGSGSTGTSGSGTGSTSDTMSGTGQTIGTGSDASPTTPPMTGTGTGGTQPYDQSGTTYPLGQPMPSQGTWGQSSTYGQPPPAAPPTTTAPVTTSTTTTTAGYYDPTVTADAEGGKYKVRPNRPMLITGSAIFLGSYAATAVQGAVSDLDADRKNLIPVAGPWINMSERPCNLGDNCSTGENVNNLLLIGSGVAQGAGIAIAIASLFVPETKERSSMTSKAAPAKPELRFMPGQMGRGGAGAFAVGTF